MGRSFSKLPNITQNIVKEDISDRINGNNLRNDTLTETPTEKSYSVGLYDIDEALGYFFDNTLKPSVEQNGKQIPVPSLYGSPERWTQMKKDGYFRDNKSKLVLPLILYRRTNISRNDNLYFPRLDQLHYVSAKKWDNKNIYNRFNKLNGIDERKKSEWQKNTDRYVLTSLPNYVIINYEGIIWTAFVEQMNKLIEKITFNEGTYWGEKDKFKFRTEIDGFDTAVELTTDTERMVKTNFTMTLYGYLLPEEVGGKSTSRISLSPKSITFNIEEIL